MYLTLLMLYKPHLHGSYIEDIFFVGIFIVMLAVFLYFYFSNKGEPEMDDEQKPDPPNAHEN